MSEQTLELAREVMRALSAREVSTLVALTDPEVEWYSFFADLREGGAYRGHDGMRQYVEDLGEAWEIVRGDVDDGVAVDDVVLLVGRIHYRGKGSGVETEEPAGWIFKFRNGKVVLFRVFRDPAKSLEALGAP